MATISTAWATVLVGAFSMGCVEADVGDPSLPAGLHPLSGSDPDLPVDDLVAFDSVYGGATVVALGEAIHGSQELNEIKSRQARHLIADLGFRVVAFESPAFSTRIVDAYVETCDGDVERVVQDGLYWAAWRSVVAAEFVDWLCAYNQEHPTDPVSLFGYDIQDEVAAIAYLDEAFTAIGLNPGETAIVAVNNCFGVLRLPYQADTYEECLVDIAALGELVESRRDDLEVVFQEEELIWIDVALIAVEHRFEQLAQYWWFDGEGWTPMAYEERDEGMAEVFQLLHGRDPDQRALLWTANSHASARHEAGMEADESYWAVGARSMGSHLTDAYGDEYLPLAAMAAEVWIDDAGPVELDDRSLAVYLDTFGEPHAFFEIPAPELDFDESWKVLYNGTLVEVVPEEQWRGVFFMEYSGVMEALE